MQISTLRPLQIHIFGKFVGLSHFRSSNTTSILRYSISLRLKLSRNYLFAEAFLIELNEAGLNQ